MAKSATATATRRKTKKARRGRPRKSSGVNKSAEIRKTAEENPGVGPTEIAKITSDRIGKPVSASLVSNVLGKGPGKRGRKRKAMGARRSSASTDTTTQGLKSAFTFVRNVGGIEEAKKYLGIAEMAAEAVGSGR